MEYKECFEIMGTDRNSYSKTDLKENEISGYIKLQDSIDSENAKRKTVTVNGWKGQLNYKKKKKTIMK